MNCPRCNQPMGTGDNDLCRECKDRELKYMGIIATPPPVSGWICQKCGRSNSPYIQTCPCWIETSKPHPYGCFPQTGILYSDNVTGGTGQLTPPS